MINRIHITGASGSGTTTLGKIIGRLFDYRHFDSDNYFWTPTEPPYEKPRLIPLRQQLLKKDLDSCDRWVLSGSVCYWGDFITEYLDLVIFLYVPTDVRIERLKKRELERYGIQTQTPGNYLYDKTKAFLEWAGSYDREGLDIRSLTMHNKWLENLSCPVVRLENTGTMEHLLSTIKPLLDK